MADVGLAHQAGVQSDAIGKIEAGAQTDRLDSLGGNESRSKGVKNNKDGDWTVVNLAQQSTSNKKAPVNKNQNSESRTLEFLIPLMH